MILFGLVYCPLLLVLARQSRGVPIQVLLVADEVIDLDLVISEEVGMPTRLITRSEVQARTITAIQYGSFGFSPSGTCKVSPSTAWAIQYVPTLYFPSSAASAISERFLQS